MNSAAVGGDTERDGSKPPKGASPINFMRTRNFDRAPLVLGEAPSPIDPNKAWSDKARATQKLSILVYGSRTPEAMERLRASFSCINLIAEYPGAKYPSSIAAMKLERLWADGELRDRVVFLMGSKVHSCFEELNAALGRGDVRSKFDVTLGCSGWLGHVELSGFATLFILAPHPQIYFRFLSDISLQRLAILFRTAGRVSLGGDPTQQPGKSRAASRNTVSD